MTRPLWDKRTPFWLALALIAVGACVFVIWRGERKEAEHRDREAALAQQLDEAKAAADRAAKLEAEQEKLNERNKTLLAEGSERIVLGQLTIVGLAYQKASDKLGRAPTTPDELAPFLPTADGLTSPRDHEAFEIAWGTPLTPPGRLLAWERTPWENGGRFVLTTGAQPKRVTAEEFKRLSSK